MRNVLIVYIVFSLLTFAVLRMKSYTISKEIRRELPELASQYDEQTKHGVLEKAFNRTTTLIACFVPIANLLIFCCTLFYSDEVKNATVLRMKDKVVNTYEKM